MKTVLGIGLLVVWLHACQKPTSKEAEPNSSNTGTDASLELVDAAFDFFKGTSVYPNGAPVLDLTKSLQESGGGVDNDERFKAFVDSLADAMRRANTQKRPLEIEFSAHGTVAEDASTEFQSDTSPPRRLAPELVAKLIGDAFEQVKLRHSGLRPEFGVTTNLSSCLTACKKSSATPLLERFDHEIRVRLSDHQPIVTKGHAFSIKVSGEFELIPYVSQKDADGTIRMIHRRASEKFGPVIITEQNGEGITSIPGIARKNVPKVLEMLSERAEILHSGINTRARNAYVEIHPEDPSPDSITLSNFIHEQSFSSKGSGEGLTEAMKKLRNAFLWANKVDTELEAYVQTMLRGRVLLVDGSLLLENTADSELQPVVRTAIAAFLKQNSRGKNPATLLLRKEDAVALSKEKRSELIQFAAKNGGRVKIVDTIDSRSEIEVVHMKAKDDNRPIGELRGEVETQEVTSAAEIMTKFQIIKNELNQYEDLGEHISRTMDEPRQKYGPARLKYGPARPQLPADQPAPRTKYGPLSPRSH